VESAVVDDIRDDELTRAAEQADVDVLDAARDAEIAAGAITAGQVAALSELLVARFPNKTPKDAAARRARHDFIAAQTGCRVDKLEDLTVGQADAVIAVLSD
jgi:hypothetical protein